MLAVHHAICAAICFPCYHSHLWNRRLAKSIKQLSAMSNDAPMFLVDTWQESGNILKNDQWDVEAIAEAHETCRLRTSVDIENTGKNHRLVSDNPDRVTSQACVPDHDVLSIAFLDLVKLTMIDDHPDRFFNIVWFIRAIWN